MAGFTTNEGLALLADMACKRTLTDRDANLLLGLFTNSGATATLSHSTVTEPTGTGYGRITLTDASWTGSAATRSYATQTFTAGAGGWTGSVYGYFIITIASGGTPRVVWAEIDPSGPYTFNAGDTYAITLNVTFS